VDTPDEDRSKWRYEDNGPPIVTVLAFRQWLGLLPLALDMGETLFTAAAWPTWRQQATDGTLDAHFRTELAHWSNKVRYPADDMAYVFAPVLHPDQDEPITITEPQKVYMLVYTLLREDGQWRLHSVGRMIPPADVGKTAYSW
jgi:hypothetical protein